MIRYFNSTKKVIPTFNNIDTTLGDNMGNVVAVRKAGETQYVSLTSRNDLPIISDIGLKVEGEIKYITKERVYRVFSIDRKNIGGKWLPSYIATDIINETTSDELAFCDPGWDATGSIGGARLPNGGVVLCVVNDATDEVHVLFLDKNFDIVTDINTEIARGGLATYQLCEVQAISNDLVVIKTRSQDSSGWHSNYVHSDGTVSASFSPAVSTRIFANPFIGKAQGLYYTTSAMRLYTWALDGTLESNVDLGINAGTSDQGVTLDMLPDGRIAFAYYMGSPTRIQIRTMTSNGVLDAGEANILFKTDTVGLRLSVLYCNNSSHMVVMHRQQISGSALDVYVSIYDKDFDLVAEEKMVDRTEPFNNNTRFRQFSSSLYGVTCPEIIPPGPFFKYVWRLIDINGNRPTVLSDFGTPEHGAPDYMSKPMHFYTDSEII